MARGVLGYQARRWSKRLVGLAIAAAVVVAGTQAILQYFAWDLMGNNLASLLIEVGTIGEAGFREHFVEACATSGIQVDPADVTVVIKDDVRYSASAPYVASFYFGFFELHPVWEVTATAVRLPQDDDP